MSYTGKDITVLEGLDPVRKRPAMYIGGTSKTGYHHLLWEVLDNSIDEVIAKHATRIDIVLNKDKRTISVEDNGRGIPVDTIAKYKKSALEVILSTLHAGGKFEGKNYAHSGGLHGVGASVVNALSTHLTAEVKRDGKLYTLEFSEGKALGKIKSKSGARGTGTKISFIPDTKIFGSKLSFDPILIASRLEAKSYIHRNVKINFRDETTTPTVTQTFHHAGGISEYLEKVVADRGKPRVPSDCKAFFLSKMEDKGFECPFELAMLWTEGTDEHIKSYVNGVPTPSGGTHENGLRGGVVKAVRNYMSTHKLAPKGVTITADDIREGMTVILSTYVTEPQFQGQTKERLNNPGIAAVIDGAVRPVLEQWLNENKSVADSVIARIVLAARARAASRAASAAVTRKSAISHRLNLPGKLADCSSTDPMRSELFLVEGDSAGGSAKQGRNRKNQAILALRGKVLNAEQASITKLMANKELGNIVSALGCGIGANIDLSKLRYDKVFLLMDADADGLHIATLLLTFFYRYMKPLIDNKHIYIAQPPLYRIDIGKKTFYALDDFERDEILAEHLTGTRKSSITRFKGLGEMSPAILNETTLDPRTRTALRVTIHEGDEMATDLCISELLGKDASARYRLITESSGEIEDIDV